MNWLLPRLIGFSLLVGGCGGNVVAGAGSGGTGAAGTGASGTGAAGTGGSGTGGSPCPVAEPSGGACSPEGFRCTYGDSVRADCRSASVCTQGQWTGATSACSESSVCTSLTSPPAGQVCNAEGAFCAIGTTLCACSPCLQGPCMAPPIKWQCAGPPTTPGCPAVVPNDGTACAQEGVQCTYGFICGGSGAQVECKNGLWFWDLGITCGV